MVEGSAIAPCSISPLAALCVTGGMREMPSSSMAMQCRSVKGFFHITEFMDGATKSGFL